MRLQFLYLLIPLIFALKANGQTGIHIGVGAMPQQTWMVNQHDSEAAESQFKYVPTYGLAATFKLGYNFGPPFGIHTGLVYSQQGQISSYVDSTGSTLQRYRNTSYVKVPLFIHVSSANGGRGGVQPVIMSLGAGAYYALLQTAEISESGVAVPQPELDAAGLSVKDLFDDSEIGVSWYVGAAIKVAEDWLWLDILLRGDYGFTDAENKLLEANGNRIYELGRANTNNFNWGLNVGLTFVLDPSGGGGGGQHWFR